MSERRRLPNRRAAQIVMFEHNDGRRYRATYGTFGNGALAEIFLDTSKPNAAIQQHADDSAVLVSLLLQNGVAPEAIKHSISGPIRTALDLWLGRPAP